MAAKKGHMVSGEERRDGGEKEKEKGEGGREGKEERNEKKDRNRVKMIKKGRLSLIAYLKQCNSSKSAI